MKPEPHSIERLIGRYLDGLATEAEAAELSQALEGDPAVREEYLAMARLHAALASDESLRMAPPARSRGEDRVGTGRSFPWGWLAAAAGLMLAGYVGMVSPTRPPIVMSTGPALPFAMDGPLSIPAESADPVAVLKRAVGVEWDEAQSAPAVGESLPPRWLRLRAGTVQLEFLSGARLLVEGPAALRLDTINAAYLESGKASAHVPDPAHGFRLLGPGLGVEDLGTAFGMEIKAGREPEVHVFDGSVSLSNNAAGDTVQTVYADRAVKLHGTGFLEVPLRVRDFPDGQELARRAAVDSARRYDGWKAALPGRMADPAALVGFTFERETEWLRTVDNPVGTRRPEAAPGAPALDATGTLVGAGWTSGRWAGKQGIEFRSRGDRLCFHVPGQHAGVTLAAWVRVDTLANDYNALVLPSHYAVGSLHWTLERGGELRLARLRDPANPLSADGWDGPVSGPAVSSMDFGRWIFLATTYDAVTGQVAHYRDGQLVGSGVFLNHLPVVLGQVEFGNWGADGTTPDNAWIRQQLRHQRQRNFVGRLDELTILSRALSPGELAALFQGGRP